MVSPLRAFLRRSSIFRSPPPFSQILPPPQNPRLGRILLLLSAQTIPDPTLLSHGVLFLRCSACTFCAVRLRPQSPGGWTFLFPPIFPPEGTCFLCLTKGCLVSSFIREGSSISPATPTAPVSQYYFSRKSDKTAR